MLQKAPDSLPELSDIRKQDSAVMVENRKWEIENMVRIVEGLNKKEKISNERVTLMSEKNLI